MLAGDKGSVASSKSEHTLSKFWRPADLQGKRWHSHATGCFLPGPATCGHPRSGQSSPLLAPPLAARVASTNAVALVPNVCADSHLSSAELVLLGLGSWAGDPWLRLKLECPTQTGTPPRCPRLVHAGRGGTKPATFAKDVTRQARQAAGGRIVATTRTSPRHPNLSHPPTVPPAPPGNRATRTPTLPPMAGPTESVGKQQRTK